MKDESCILRGAKRSELAKRHVVLVSKFNEYIHVRSTEFYSQCSLYTTALYIM